MAQCENAASSNASSNDYGTEAGTGAGKTPYSIDVGSTGDAWAYAYGSISAADGGDAYWAVGNYASSTAHFNDASFNCLLKFRFNWCLWGF